MALYSVNEVSFAKELINIKEAIARSYILICDAQYHWQNHISQTIQ